MIKTSTINKLLTYKTFQVGDYSYDFFYVDKEENYFKLKINCTLPKKNCSYIHDKMIYDVDSILIETFNFLGESFSYSHEILVDGEQSKNAYINEKKHLEAIENLNQQLSDIILLKGDLKVKLSYQFPENFIWVRDQESIIDLDVLINIEKVFWKDNLVRVSDDRTNDFSEFFFQQIHDDYELSNKVESVIYRTWEDELQVEKTDLYYQASLILSKIYGKTIEHGNWPDNFQPLDFFI